MSYYREKEDLEMMVVSVDMIVINLFVNINMCLALFPSSIH